MNRSQNDSRIQSQSQNQSQTQMEGFGTEDKENPIRVNTSIKGKDGSICESAE